MANFQLVKTVRFSDKLKVVEKSDGRVQTYGISTSETPDGDGEICDYEDAKKQYQIWSDAFECATKAAGQEVSKGNIRIQHGMDMGGKAVEIEYDDGAKSISMRTEAADSGIGDKLKRGMFTGLSHAGSYLYRRCDKCRTDIAKGSFCPVCKANQLIRYAPILAEVSYVDNPCNPDARFTFVKADGTEESKEFGKAGDAISPGEAETRATLAQILARLDQVAPPINAKPEDAAKVSKGSLHLVNADGETHLPYTGPDGKPDHNLMGAAWAALHGGYRGSKYEGPDKDGAITRLKALYEKEGMETPAAKFARLATAAIEKCAVEKMSLKKGMWEVAQVAQILEQIAWVQQTAVWERECEQDKSTLPEEFLAVLEHATQVFLHQVAEETSELTEAARAATAAAEAVDAAEKTSKGVKGMDNTFVKIFTPVLGVEKAHSLAHHMGKMAKCVKDFHADAHGMHKAHHEAMMGHLDALDGDDATKAAKAKGHLAKAKECADGHMAEGLDMHKEHASDMGGMFGKLGKILGVEEADKWANEASDVPESVGGEPKGATTNEYEKARKSVTAVADKDSFSKAEVADLISATLGEFMKNLGEGIAEANKEPEVAKAAPGIGERAQVRWPQSGQGQGVTKSQDTTGQGAAATAAKTADAPTPADIEKAMRGDVEALKKCGFGSAGEQLPPEVAASMWAMAK